VVAQFFEFGTVPLMKGELITGYVFLCSDMTQQECFDRLLFGGGEKYANRVRGVQKGHKLFLYNYNSKKLYGIFEAASDPQTNIDPAAWKGEYPWQIRVKSLKDLKPISREDIKDILGFDRAGRPTARLDVSKVEALELLFNGEKRAQTYADDIQHITEDGHRVRSRPEQIIDNWLYKNRIAHGYETPIRDTKRCDFEVPTEDGSIYIEYWGLNDEAYLKNKDEKLAIYKKHHLALVSLEQDDLKNLDQILGEKFKNEKQSK